MKKLFMVLAAALLLAAPMFAQSTFSDVPRDHWAYDAVSELESLGLVIGYPDGEFKGKRTMTRYEFAVILARLLPFLDDGGINADAFAKTGDLDKYMLKSDYAPAADADLSGLATTDALAKIQALADEFAPELAALGVDVNVLKADVAALKSRVAALEDEQARIKISGSANFMFMSTISGDSPAYDMDGIFLAEKFAKRHQSFMKDVQIDIKGRVNDKVNVYTSLVMSDFAKKEATKTMYDTAIDEIVPYYMYAVSEDAKWGRVRVGRMPFQGNRFLFRRSAESSFFDVARIDDGNFPVEGFEYANRFGSFDLRAFGFRPIYEDWNASQTKYLMGQKVTVNAGAVAGFNWKDARISALYDKLGAENKLAIGPDKVTYYGGSIYVPFGQIYVDGNWYRMKYNNDCGKASIWDAKLGFANDKLSMDAGYKTVEKNWMGFASPDSILDLASIDNYKGWYANAKYNFSDVFDVHAAYKNYKADDKGLYSAYDGLKYIKAGIGYDVTPLDTITADYERAKFGVVGQTPKTLTIGWKRKVGKNAYINTKYMYEDYKPLQKSHLVSGQLVVNF